MNRAWSQIVEGISDRYPGREIFIYTNGTIAPRDDKLVNLKGKKVNFIITEYGKLSRNLSKLTSNLINLN